MNFKRKLPSLGSNLIGTFAEISILDLCLSVDFFDCNWLASGIFPKSAKVPRVSIPNSSASIYIISVGGISIGISYLFLSIDLSKIYLLQLLDIYRIPSISDFVWVVLLFALLLRPNRLMCWMSTKMWLNFEILNLIDFVKNFDLEFKLNCLLVPKNQISKEIFWMKLNFIQNFTEIQFKKDLKILKSKSIRKNNQNHFTIKTQKFISPKMKNQ